MRSLSVSRLAGKPVITHVSFEGEDAEASAFLREFCGFDVIVFADVRAAAREYPDGSVRETAAERITYTAGDQQLFEHNTFQVYFDADQESSATRVCRSGSWTRAAA